MSAEIDYLVIVDLVNCNTEQSAWQDQEKWMVKLKMTNMISAYLKNLKNLISNKGCRYYVLLFITTLVAIWGEESKMILYLYSIWIFVYLLEDLLLVNKSFFFYLAKTFVLILLGFEVIFKIAYEHKVIPANRGSDSIISEDSLLGNKFKPSSNGRKFIETAGSDTLYNVLYSCDSLSRRVSENADTSQTNSNKLRHALFFGCSFTFGEGLNYESTFPFLFEKIDTTFKSYNYGFCGYCPSQMALLFNEGVNTVNKKVILGENGFALYTYIDDQQNRVYGGSRYLGYAGNTPDVNIENGRLIISKRNKIHLLAARLIRASYTLEYFKISLTYPHSENHYKRFAEIINYSAEKYLSIYPGNQFYIGIFPANNVDISWVKYLSKKIRVLYVPVPHDFQANPGKYLISAAYDPHPNYNYNSYYIKYIYGQINKYNNHELLK